MTAATVVVLNAAWAKAARPTLTEVVWVGGVPSGQPARFRMIEDALWREATGPAPTEIDVHTSFGVTRAYRWTGDGTPIVLLHGGGMTSVSWAPYAQTLSSRDVYAQLLVLERGWSPKRYGRWISDALIAALVA